MTVFYITAARFGSRRYLIRRPIRRSVDGRVESFAIGTDDRGFFAPRCPTRALVRFLEEEEGWVARTIEPDPPTRDRPDRIAPNQDRRFVLGEPLSWLIGEWRFGVIVTAEPD